MNIGNIIAQSHKLFLLTFTGNGGKILPSQVINLLYMIQFFQVVFLTASVILIVLNILEFNKWQEGKKEGSTKPHPVKWFPFILTSLVAVGCALNIIIQWISKA